MKISIPIFRGRAPRVSPRLLADGYGQTADSPRLLSGDLESWQERLQTATLPKGPPVNTIHRLASRTGDQTPFWLHWTPAELAAGAVNVDVALGPIPADATVATFFTGTTLGPRYTNKFLATDPSQRGSAAVGAYPYASLPLGINAPTVAPTIVQMLPTVMPGIESFNFDGSDISQWEIGEGVNTEFNDTLTQRSWVVAQPPDGAYFGTTTAGYPLPAFRGVCARSDRIMMQRDFRLDEAAGFDYSFDYYQDAVSPTSDFGGFTHRFLSVDGAGPSVFHQSNGTVVFTEGTGSQQTYTTSLTTNTRYTMRVRGMLGADGYFAITIDWIVAAAVVFTLSGRAQLAGGNMAFEITSRRNQQRPRLVTVDNIVGTLVQMDPVAPLPVFTNYVYTTINTQGQESAPSPPSMAVTVDNGIINRVTIPAQPMGVDVAMVRLYRASNSLTQAQYLFVAELSPPLPIDYDDAAMSSAIGPDALITTDFDPPPSSLMGIIALAGGALAGFAGNQLCFSEPEYPYAWPIRYRLTTDYNIVAIAAVNSSVIVLTEAFYQIASGNLPGNYAMEKQTYPQGCASKRSVAYITGGVLFASPDGLYLVNGSGPPTNTTELLFAREEWQALNPPSIIGVAHDDRYFGFYDATAIGGDAGGFILDFRQGGFGLIDIADRATAVYADPITDTLYFAERNANPAMPAPLFAWDSGSARRRYLWRSRLYLNRYPISFQAAQVRARDYTDLTLRIYADGALIFTRVITSQAEFTTPPLPARETEIELEGTSRVYLLELAERMDELV